MTYGKESIIQKTNFYEMKTYMEVDKRNILKKMNLEGVPKNIVKHESI